MEMEKILRDTTLKEANMKRILEIKAAEGGEDAKLFVENLAVAYQKMFSRFG